VAEHLAHDPRVDAKAKQQRGRAVAEVVEANPRQSGPLQQRSFYPLLEVGGMEGLTHGIREDQPVVVPLQAKQELLLALPGQVAPERPPRR
jgi:hypothetical protein